MAASTNENVKINKQERKLLKKQNKAKYTLMKHDGIGTSDNPTRILCINNGGLDAGMTYNEIKELFSPHGTVEDIIMLSMKPYCFVCFATASEAETAYKALNGYHVHGGLHSPQIRFYITFVNQVPADIGPTLSLPPGLILLEDFVTPECEQKLLLTLDWDDGPDMVQKCLKHRNVQHFGYEFKYGVNNVDPEEPLPLGIPEECHELLNRAVELDVVHHFPDQLTVNQYKPGQGIPPHVDTPSAFEDGLLSLSLGSQTVMDFRHPDGRHLSVLLPRRSLIVMTGESRFIWSHGITPRKSDIITTSDGNLTLLKRGIRTSFTFRKLTIQREQDDATLKKETTDHSNSDIPHSEEEAVKLEQLHVHEVYNEIADHFSGTRYKAWPQVADFIASVPTGSLLADIGCGNGKYLGLNKSIFAIGSDRSSSLSTICQERQFQVFVADVMSLPLRSNTFDVCLCIAVIHHLSTEERRKKAISELVRILCPGGHVLIYVWAMEQKMDKLKSKYLKDSKLQKQFNKQNKEFCDENQNESSAHQDVTKATQSMSRCQETTVQTAGSEATSHCSKHVATSKLCESTAHTSTDHVATSNGGAAQSSMNYLKYLHEVAENENNENLACASSMQAASNSDHQPRTCQSSETSQENISANITWNTSHHLRDQPCDLLPENKIHKQCLSNSETEVCESDQTKNVYLSDQSVNDTNGKTFKNEVTDTSISETHKTKAAHSCNSKLPVHINRTPFKQQDMLVPWQLKGNNSETKSNSTFHRFYHVFKEGEIEGLCQTVKDCVVVKSYYDQGNWCVILEKKLILI